MIVCGTCSLIFEEEMAKQFRGNRDSEGAQITEDGISCPRCGSDDLRRLHKCSACENLHEKDELISGALGYNLCPDCYNALVSKVAKVISANTSKEQQELIIWQDGFFDDLITALNIMWRSK